MKHIDFQYGVQYRPTTHSPWYNLSSPNYGIDLIFDEPGAAALVLKEESNKPQNRGVWFRIVRRAVTPWEEA